MVQRIFQDPAGTIPAILPGQPVGLVQRMAGTVDATQAVALSKPTLARWPQTGRRNLLTSSMFNISSLWGMNGVGVERNPDGSAFLPVGSGGLFSSGVNRPVFPGSTPFTASIEYEGTGVLAFRIESGGALTSAKTVTFNLSTGSLVSFAGATSDDASYTATHLGGQRYRLSITATTIPEPTGAPILNFYRTANAPEGEGMTIRDPQLETGPAQSPFQRVTNLNDITQAGVPDQWHLFNDGGDSLTCVLPPGTYGVANLAVDKSYRFETVVSDGSTPITTLIGERQLDAIYRLGAFSPAEQQAILDYWGRVFS